MHDASIALTNLLELRPAFEAGVVFHVAMRKNKGVLHLVVSFAPWLPQSSRARDFYALPTALAGDAPNLFHPLYIGAVLESRPFAATLPGDEPRRWRVPAVAFETDEWTRRSMTLNGMRMTTEWQATGSRRVLQLIDSRLEAGQRDVVHDVLVYLARQRLDLRQEAHDARDLRSQSIAAYLGLETARVAPLLQAPALNAARIAARLAAGEAGPLRRQLDVAALLVSQIALLRLELHALLERDRPLRRLSDEVVTRLIRQG